MSDRPAVPSKQAQALPFDHLTLAEVAECERLLRLDQGGKLYGSQYGMLHRMLAKRHPPLYDRHPEPPRAA